MKSSFCKDLLQSTYQGQDLDLIFLPGASGQTAFWQPVMHRLQGLGQSKVIAYPEFDGQAAHPQVIDFESLQSYVLAQVPAYSVVIAQSMGGIFAVQAALQAAKQITALVLVATSGGIDLSPFNVADWRYDYQQRFDLPNWFTVTKTQTIAESMQQISCPILLIWGDDDPISPVTVGHYLLQQFQHAQLYIIEGGQHDLAHVHADQVSRCIQAFLQELKSTTD